MSVAYTKTFNDMRVEANMVKSHLSSLLTFVQTCKRGVTRGLRDVDFNPGLVYENAQDILDIASTQKTLLTTLLSESTFLANRYRFTWRTDTLLANWAIDVDNGSSKGEIEATFFGAHTVGWNSVVAVGDFIQISNSENGNDGIYEVDSKLTSTTKLRFTTILAGTDNSADSSAVLTLLKSTY